MTALYASGIYLAFSEGNWIAEVQYSKESPPEPCIEGTIGPRHYGILAQSIDLAKTAAESIGVVFYQPSIFVEGDGEDASVALPPDWRQLIAQQCKRLGWESVYED